jgi:galactitol-specific phosphotransferase system IIB component
MKKIVALCGQGLGSSLIVEMNIKKALEELEIDDVEVAHTNLNSFDPNDASITAVVCGNDLSDAVDFENKIVLNNLLDINEIKSKISAFLKHQS